LRHGYNASRYIHTFNDPEKICTHDKSLNWAKKVKILLFQEKKMKCSSVTFGTEPINIYKDKQKYQKLLFQPTIKFYDKRTLASNQPQTVAELLGRDFDRKN
jgi:hypothetical protein